MPYVCRLLELVKAFRASLGRQVFINYNNSVYSRQVMSERVVLCVRSNKDNGRTFLGLYRLEISYDKSNTNIQCSVHLHHHIGDRGACALSGFTLRTHSLHRLSLLIFLIYQRYASRLEVFRVRRV